MYVSKSKNKEMPLVTVICMTYNQARFVKQCLESILAQKTTFPFKIFIHDDASNDSTASIVREYGLKYPSMIESAYEKENQFLKKTLFKYMVGLFKKMDTKYFTCCDGDDYWLGDTKMQSAIDYLESHPEFTAYASNTYIDDENKKGEKIIMFDNKNIDYDFFTTDKVYIAHTSGTFFRNIFTHKELDEIEKYNTDFENCFLGDTVRNLYHLKKGKFHYEKKVESVYRITTKGIYAKFTDLEKDCVNLKMLEGILLYFKQERADLFLENFCWSVNKIFLSYKTVKLLTVLNANGMLERIYRVIEYNNKFNFLFDLSSSKNFCFYLPSYTICEYTELFIVLSKYLSEKLNLDVYYIDYKDGFASKQLKNSRVKFIYYTDRMDVVEQDIPFNIVLPATFAFQMPKFKSIFSKVIFLFENYRETDWIKSQTEINEKQIESFLLLKCLVWMFRVLKRF
ncbi:MAG: glycosyltransferase [Endomicrobium sp.]|jgi:glycosyltransferase involved in cell wall biosynthesis|nr:glycosyltransferase [Endomicrobium sp.]